MFILNTEDVMAFVEVENYLRDHADELLINIDPNDIDFVRLGNPTDINWDPAAIGCRVMRNHAAYNTCDFWLVRTREGKALLAMTTEGSRYSTDARSFNENAREFTEARERLVDNIQNEGISDKMLALGRSLMSVDYSSLYSAALRRTFHEGPIPAQWREMPHVSGLC